jgi:phosphatidylcholine synthase
MRTRRILPTPLAWLVHLYTATGAVCALLAWHAAAGGRVRDAFAWLTVQVAIDSSDGVLARAARVEEVLPRLDGQRLDDVVDYLAYVAVPASMVITLGLVAGPLGWVVAAGMLVSSAVGFARVDAKTADHFFTGFPSYWNIVVLYLVAFRCGPWVSAGIVAALAALVFVPTRYVYPTRTPVLRRLTIAVGAVWALMMVGVIATLPDVPRALLVGSLAFPAYYVALSFVLDRRTRQATARLAAGRAGFAPRPQR